MRFLQNKLLAILVTPLLILLIAGSFYRFVILRDYMVTYEIECDPVEESCYVYCEDEACSEPSYYAYMEKYAAAVYEQCGPDITECETADICLPEENDQCTITYCDAATEECSYPVVESDEEELSIEEEQAIEFTGEATTTEQVFTEVE